jgi:hypothetical protein
MPDPTGARPVGSSDAGRRSNAGSGDALSDVGDPGEEGAD